jgi:hypothetical protein
LHISLLSFPCFHFNKQDAQKDLEAAEQQHGGSGHQAEECDILREKMRHMTVLDKEVDKKLCSKMFK